VQAFFQYLDPGLVHHKMPGLSLKTLSVLSSFSHKLAVLGQFVVKRNTSPSHLFAKE